MQSSFDGKTFFHTCWMFLYVKSATGRKKQHEKKRQKKKERKKIKKKEEK